MFVRFNPVAEENGTFLIDHRGVAWGILREIALWRSKGRSGNVALAVEPTVFAHGSSFLH